MEADSDDDDGGEDEDEKRIILGMGRPSNQQPQQHKSHRTMKPYLTSEFLRSFFYVHHQGVGRYHLCAFKLYRQPPSLTPWSKV